RNPSTGAPIALAHTLARFVVALTFLYRQNRRRSSLRADSYRFLTLHRWQGSRTADLRELRRFERTPAFGQRGEVLHMQPTRDPFAVPGVCDVAGPGGHRRVQRAI